MSGSIERLFSATSIPRSRTEAVSALRLSKGKFIVTDGRFIGLQGPMAGRPAIQVNFLDEAIEWSKHFRRYTLKSLCRHRRRAGLQIEIDVQ